MSLVRRLLGRPLPARVEIVQTELDRFRRPRFLEIGVDVGVVFLHVTAAEKVAVDPVNRVPRWKWLAHPNTARRGRFHEITSDEYFERLDEGVRFNVIFVDGFHTHEQSRRDIDNALAHLAPDGVVLVHDCNPPSEAAGGPDPDRTGGEGWCGEVWKTIIELRASRGDLVVEVLDTDYGVGVVRRGKAGLIELARPAAELAYADLAADRTRLLGLRRPPAPPT